MKGRINNIFSSIIASVLLFAGCEYIHEWPEPGKEVDPTRVETHVKIKITPKISLATYVTKAAAPIDINKEVASKYDRRYIVNILPEGNNNTIIYAETFTTAADNDEPLEFTIDLQTRKYTLIVWMDYILKGSNKDTYYITASGLQAVHTLTRSEYCAGTDFKDAQLFRDVIDLTPYVEDWYTEITFESQLSRPVAKITFLASDIEEYAKKSLGGRTDYDKIASEFKVEVRYAGYLPTGINVYTGKLNDSETGYSFNFQPRYPISYPDHTNLTIMGSDYVFVNGEESSLTISAFVKNSAGEIINEVNNIVVPTYRGKETVVIDKFLTKEYAPGVGINPDFDGEFNIIIPST